MRRLVRAFKPRPPARKTTAVSPATDAVLRAAVRALLDAFVADHGPYDELLLVAAQRDPGRAVVYERFARAADRAALALSDLRFVVAPPPVQRAVLRRVALTRPPRLAASRAWFLLTQRRRWAYERVIVAPVLTQFARTDAHIAAGYAWPPGSPRPFPLDPRATGAAA